MSPKRVFVAMSGGVDSSVAAATLNAEGYQVVGVTLQIWPQDREGEAAERRGGCCGIEAIDSARRVARKIGIPHYVMNFRDIFARKVIADFCGEYSLGRTPNPCIACNQYIKFGLLLDKVLGMGADYLATGHYARVERRSNNYRLLRAVDRGKDQSYFLYTLGQKELRHLLLPVGGLHKAEVRRLATEMGLPVSRRESQDVCFIPDSDYRSFIAGYVSLSPGDIVDTAGRVLGRHSGLAQYTVGQRQGLGLSSNERLYVLKLDASGNRLVVGTKDQLLSGALSASKLSWISGKAPRRLSDITAKIRYQSSETGVQLCLRNGSAEVKFHQPQSAIAPGQAIVFYRGDTVLGGGVIEDTDTNFC